MSRFKFNPLTAQLEIAESFPSNIRGHVDFFADLPTSATIGDQYIVDQDSGSVFTLNKREAGLYRWNGTIWVPSADITTLSIEADDTNIGSGSSQLQAVLDHIDSIADTNTTNITTNTTDIATNSGDIDNNEIAIAANLASSMLNATNLSDHETDLNNPHEVTITQAITQDPNTNITTTQLETLSDGSDADALHTHSELTAPNGDTVAEVFNSGSLAIGPDGDIVLNAGNNPRINFIDPDTTSTGDITLDNTSIRIDVDNPDDTANSHFTVRLDTDEKLNVTTTDIRFNDYVTARDDGPVDTDRVAYFDNLGNVQVGSIPAAPGLEIDDLIDSPVPSAATAGCLYQLRENATGTGLEWWRDFYQVDERTDGLVNQQNAVFEPYLSVTYDIKDAGDYLLDFSYIFSMNNTTLNFEAHLEINGTDVYPLHIEPKDAGGAGLVLPIIAGGVEGPGTVNSGTDQFLNNSGKMIVNLPTGANTIILEFSARGAANLEAAIHRALFVLKRIP